MLFVTSAQPIADARRATVIASLARVEGRPFRFEIPVPEDPALAERTLRARAVLVDRDGRRTWSEPLDVALEP